MHKLAVVRREDKEGNTHDAAVNVSHVRYVFAQGSGSYIALEDQHDPTSNGVTPIGMKCPESVEVVLRRLNRPYWIDLAFRTGSLLVSALGVILAIVLSSS